MGLFIGLLLLLVVIILVGIQFAPDPQLQDAGRKAGFTFERQWTAETRLFKIFTPFMRMFSPLVSLCPMGKYRERLMRWLTAAGLEYEVTPNDVIALQIVMALIFPVIANTIFGGIVSMIFGFIFGIAFPIIWVLEKRRNRREAILRSMPNVVDMLALSVEAGLDFNSAAQRIIERSDDEKDPMIDELNFYLHSTKLGMSRQEALEQLAQRIDSGEIYSFCSVLIQADKMGASITDTLKQQAQRLRDERFMRAERHGAVAAQKLLVPMMVFIFPLLFIIVFAPYMLKLFYGQ